MVTVEQLYKSFGVLADAKDKAGEVGICLTIAFIRFSNVPVVKL